jgi:predicted phage-related endonuclease
VIRNFTIVDYPQRSIEWFQARCGRLTGSRARAMLTTIKSGEAAARRDVRTAMVCERLTGRPQEDGWINNDMLRGIEMEPAAIAAYELATGKMVRSTGFLAHTELMAGCSLDGDVDDMGGIIEVKAPRSATHLRYLLTRGLPSDYQAQVTHNLWISGAAYCDFVSFDDRLPEPLHLFIHRVPRPTDFEMAMYERTVRAFLAECDDEFARVQELMSCHANAAS